MKHLILVVTLLLLGALVTTSAFAGSAVNGKQSKLLVKDVLHEDSNNPLAKGGQANTVLSEVPEPTPTMPVVFGTPLAAGTYSINPGGAGPYWTLADAVAKLNGDGIAGDGDVIFEFAAGTHTSNPVVLGVIAGTDGSNGVTFRPATGADVTVNFIALGGNGKGLSLVGSSYVTIDGHDGGGNGSMVLQYNESVSVFPTSDSRGATIYATGTTNLTVQNATVRGIVEPLGLTSWDDAEDARAAIYLRSVSGANVDPTIDNCVLGRASYGVLASAGQSTVTVTNCSIGGAFDDPVMIGGININGGTIDIHHNVVDGMQYNGENYFTYTGVIEFFPGSAIHAGMLFQVMLDGSTVHDNIINDIKYADNGFEGLGISLYGMRTRGTTAAGFTVYNNAISGVGGDDPYALYVGWRPQNVTGTHNSFSFTGSTPGTGDAAVWVLFPTGGGVLNSNIFASTVSGGSDQVTLLTNSGVASLDNNVWYAAGTTDPFDLASQNGAGYDLSSAVGNPYFLSASDLHIDTTQLSAASDMGAAGGVTSDYDGDTRNVSTPDAGFDEFNLVTPYDKEVSPLAVTEPGTTGQPFGAAIAPKVIIRNNRNNAVASFNVRLKFDSLGTTVYNQVTTSGAMGALESKEVTFPNWTPYMNDPYDVTAITELSGDQYLDNDTLTRSQIVVPLIVVSGSYNSCFESGPETFGWNGTGDFELSSSFTKLEGPYGGSGSSWVTAPGAPGSGMSDQLNSFILSPLFDLSSLNDVYVSFYHSIFTEANWDRTFFQYTTDGGATWENAGTLNDPNGINWYNESLYEHANSGDYDTPGCLDTATYSALGAIAGPIPIYGWSSNGDCANDPPTQDPKGWIFAQLNMTAELANVPEVRFRYVSFTDFGTHGDGAAFDCFTVSDAATPFTGTISGTKWGDTDGNGINDDANPEAGVVIVLSYFGVPTYYDTTDVNGDYSFNLAAPGTYTVNANDGLAKTYPPGGTWTIEHSGVGDSTGKDFGNYDGSISGTKYEDVNNNGANDSEPGLSGWTINVHKDSANGAIVATGHSGVGGAYTIPVPPGTYYVTEVVKPNTRRVTPASGSHTVVISGTSGSGTAKVTGKDFGNFLYATLKVQLNVDLNGDGNATGDVLIVPSGSTSNFTVKKNGAVITGGNITLGGGIATASFLVDTGTYVIEEATFTPGWRRTLGGTQNKVVTTSQQQITAQYLDFKYITVSGTKFDDLNGNGVKDGGEPGLEGWTITVGGAGTKYGDVTAITDVNGDYAIDSVGPGAQTVAETPQAGWTKTLPVAANYSFTGQSGNTITTSGYNFGNFADANVDGIVYRDYNGNGVMDPEDTPISGVDVNLAVNGSIDASDGSGYEFLGLVAVDTVRITVPGGYVITEPVAGEYPLALTSGGDAKGLNFGLFQGSDSTAKYRTFTADQLGADAEKKPGKAPKSTKAYDPVKNKPNTSNITLRLLDPKNGLGLSAYVGLPGQLNSGGKDKAYWQPKKGTDVWKSLNNKSLHHTGMPRGLDLDLKGKTLLKRQKNFPPNKKQNNKLFAELVALEINLLSSGVTTPAGLGALIYSDAGSPLDGKTIDEIDAYADSVMTNWEFQPLGVYNMLDSVVAKINAAFYHNATDDTALGWSVFPDVKYPALTWKAYTSVFEVPYLKPNPGAAPVNRHIRQEIVEVPTEYTLYQNYPNPFNPTTTIEFDIPNESIVTLKVYNLLGQEVATLLNRENVDFGDAVEFDASSLPSGVYLYRIVAEQIANADDGIEASTFTQVKKMVLVK